MKKYLFLFGMVLIIIGCSENVENDLTKLNIKGKVKSIHESCYKAIETADGKIKPSEILDENKMFFSRNGFLLEDISIGDKARKMQYKYNSQNQLMQGLSFENDSLEVRENYYYNDEGLLLETIKYIVFSPGAQIRTLNTYDENNYLIEKNIHIKLNPENNSKICYVNDEKGNPIEIYVVNMADNDTISESLIKYNNKNQIIESSHSLGKTDPTVRTIFSYDEFDNIRESKSLYEDESAESNNTIFQYKFDNKGNIIEEIMFFNNIPHTLTKRKIKYY